jgi:glycerol-3-phosphate acyltransferase PlsY|nr:glycerol-3-phosphate acyltransferase [uncultured Faecalimonas sp.]
MERGIFYTIIGYLSGSILYANIFGKLFCHKDVTEDTIDGNPGTTNAFLNGGFLCGICTLLCDLLKGILPVYAYMHGLPGADIWITFVLAAPVAGHIFPVFRHFRGGKGIAVSFGVLLGLYPYLKPVLLLACCFLLFSFVIVITPNYHKTFATYLLATVLVLLGGRSSYVSLGMVVISALVLGKLMLCREEREECKVKLL